jgi:hypothetical protein
MKSERSSNRRMIAFEEIDFPVMESEALFRPQGREEIM